jgi:hypothetical protein
MNVVRFRVKPGCEQQFIEAHRDMRPNFDGFLGGRVVQTGDRTFCVLAEWRNFDALAAARPEMIGLLDTLRDLLEDLGGGLGVTDPVSGDVVVNLEVTRPRAAKKSKGKRRPAKKSKATRKTKTKAKAKAKSRRRR